MRSLLLLLVLSISLPLTAQRSKQWLQQNDIGAFHEGTYTREVSTSSMELISLTGFWEPYAFGERQELKVRFYSPEADEFFLKVEELAVKKYYWMQNKPQPVEAGWHEFDGWQVDRWLRRLQLPANSLGLAVQAGPKEKRKFLPARIYHRQLKEAVKRYVAQIRLGINTSSGRYTIYSGKVRDPEKLIKEGKLLGQYGGSCFPIVIPVMSLPTEGWYMVVANVIERGSQDPHSYSFHFYHRP